MGGLRYRALTAAGSQDLMQSHRLHTVRKAYKLSHKGYHWAPASAEETWMVFY